MSVLFCRQQNWIPDDIPIKEHAKWFSYCPFVKGIETKHIPLQPDTQSHDCLTCKICYQNKIEVFNTNCGHAFNCQKCSFCIDRFVICRKKITSTQFFFLIYIYIYISRSVLLIKIDIHSSFMVVISGSSGSGKRYILDYFIKKIYNYNNEHINNYTMYVNCAHGKGIRR